MCMCVQHTRYKLIGYPKVDSQTIMAVTTNGGDWSNDAVGDEGGGDEEEEEDEQEAYRHYLIGAPRTNLSSGSVGAMVDKRAEKLGPMLDTLEEGSGHAAFAATRDLLVDAVLVVVMVAVARSEQEAEDGGDEEEGEDGEEEDEGGEEEGDEEGEDGFDRATPPRLARSAD